MENWWDGLVEILSLDLDIASHSIIYNVANTLPDSNYPCPPLCCPAQLPRKVHLPRGRRQRLHLWKRFRYDQPGDQPWRCWDCEGHCLWTDRLLRVGPSLFLGHPSRYNLPLLLTLQISLDWVPWWHQDWGALRDHLQNRPEDHHQLCQVLREGLRLHNQGRRNRPALRG